VVIRAVPIGTASMRPALIASARIASALIFAQPIVSVAMRSALMGAATMRPSSSGPPLRALDPTASFDILLFQPLILF
jgi:hypothetical protein